MWRQRLLPYPLLSDDTDDYPQSGFSCQVRSSVLSNGEVINLTLEYLLNSETLQSLIAQGEADYAVQTTCVRTYSRDLHLSGQNRQHYLSLPAENYADDIVVTPYIITIKPVSDFQAPEHNPEIRELKPEGFDLPRGAILAVAASKRVIIKETNTHSVIDLVANPATKPGLYELDFNSDRIKIYVNPVDKAVLERVRSQTNSKMGQAALISAFYLNVVTQALHCFQDHPESLWSQSIQSALERYKIDNDAESIRRNAPHYAQIILEAPIGRLLTSVTNATATE